MNRTALTIITCICLVLAMTGCRQEKHTPEEQPEASADSRVESSAMESLPEESEEPVESAEEERSELEPEASAAPVQEAAPQSRSEEPQPAAAQEGDTAAPQPFGMAVAGEETEPPQAASADVDSVDEAAVEEELLRLLNGERQEAGIPGLVMEDAMRWAARIRAPESLDSLSHERPDGTPYYTAFDEAGYAYAGKWHGENVTSLYFSQGMYSSADVAMKIFELLRSSPGHYQNMVSANFDQTGIGVAVRVEGDTIYVAAAMMFSSL